MEYLSSRREYVVAASCFISYIALSFVDGVALLNGVLLLPSAGLAIPLGILFGPPAIVGIVSGVVVSDAMFLNISLVTLFQSASVFLLSYIPYAFYKYLFGRVESDSVSRSVGEFVSVTVISSSGAAALLAWGYELAGITSFYVSFSYSFVEYLLATLIVTPVVGLLVLLGIPRTATYSDSSTPVRSRYGLITAAPLLWAVFGIVGSVGFRIRETMSLAAFRQRGVEFLFHYTHPDIFGRGGRRAQVLFGAIMLIILLVSINNVRGNVENER